MVKNNSPIVILGADGQLGRGLTTHFPQARALSLDQLDIMNQTQLAAFSWPRGGVIINAAAMTNVDDAETPEGRVLAWQVNAVAVAKLAHIASRNASTLIHFSTDYVFDGSKFPHKEEEPFSPLGVYGQTKAAGDLAVATAAEHYLIRTSWVIGDGVNFVRTMLNLAKKGISPSVVSDQTGRPTFVVQLVEVVKHLIKNQPEFGTYNVSNDGPVISWADFAREIFRLGDFKDIKVTDITTEKYNATKELVAPRPMHGEFNLDKIKSTSLSLQPWRRDLRNYLNLPN